MTELLAPEATLNSSHLVAEHPLHQILDPMLTQRGAAPKHNVQLHVCWGPERFGLQRSHAFASLSPSAKDDVLLRLTELNLALSYFIEKSGHHYAAKMILTSDALEEKAFYALMAAEEATHLRLFMNSMWFTPTPQTHFHPMLPILSDAIQWGSHDALVFVIQVLLEGFGIAHYSSLRDTCLDAALKMNFQSILRDEAKHHGAGVLLSKAQTLTSETSDQIFELSRRFIRAMETAHWIPGAFAATGKQLSSKETRSLFAELEFHSTLENRMQRLREMFHKVNYQNLFERLERDNVFQISSV